MKTSVFCTKNGSCVPHQHFQGNRKNCPRCATCRFSCTFWAIHHKCNKGRGLCKGLVCFVLFCFGALLLHSISPSTRTGQPLREPSEQAGSAYQPPPSHRGSRSNAQQKTQSPLYPIRNTTEETIQKNTDFRWLGFVNVVRRGRRGWHWADM